MLIEDMLYKAFVARDHRFDGKFFVGVKTTGVYCRPICPATPKRQNVEFFATHVEAENSGYRPCLRCRPEAAPQSPGWMGKSAVVRRALRILTADTIPDFNENQFAERFGVTSRHLRRLFKEETGKTPKQIYAENRLNFSRKLIVETSLPITNISYEAGFNSVRRFNDAFKARFGRTPTRIRRIKTKTDSHIKLTVSYRPPFDFEGLLKFYMTHQVGSLQYVEGGKYCRLVTFHNELGWITVNNNESNSYLEIEIDFPDLSAIQSILTKVRNLFDVDSDPVLITETFKSNRPISQLLSNNPGIRLPSCWEPFEMAIATILGQHVSVTVSNALVNQLINEAGKPIQDTKSGNEINLFPGPDEILRSNLKSVKTTKSRKQAILEFCLAVKEGFISLEATQNADEFRKKIMSIKGLGQWTADYMLLRALRYTDAFPESDLIIKRALEKHPIDIVNQLSPWRGYVATLFWREYA